MLICDTHADTLYAMQKKEKDSTVILDITLERLQSDGDVRVQAFALFTGPHGLAGDEGLVERELAMFERLKAAGFHPIAKIAQAKPCVPNALLTVEGGEVFHPGLERVDRFFELGVRLAGLVWNHPCKLAYPAVGGDARGLTPYGRQVVRRMHALGMGVDVSHMNAQGMADVLEMGGAAPLASHSCARALCDHPRNLTDDQLRALFQVGGFVGVNFYPPFLRESGRATLDTVVDHMVHMCELGGEKHLGLGSDFDGIDEYPVGLRHPGDLPRLFKRMRARGFGEETVEAIAGKNFQAYMERISREA